MSTSSTAKSALAARVWRGMFELLMRSAPQRTASLGRRGLTPNDSRALFSLDRHEGRSMRSLAGRWDCDPSNATWIVDRLEGLGLAARQSVAHDRRITQVVLTAAGESLRAELLEEFHQPPPELSALDRADLSVLDGLLAKLAASSTAPAAAGQVPVRTTKGRAKVSRRLT